MMKSTVAIIGDTGEFCPALVKAIMQHELRLLFISRDEAKVSHIKKELQQLPQKAEVEYLTCEKEGCWEADIIVFTRPIKTEPLLLKRIKQVSTQKLVLVISHGSTKDRGQEKLCFQELLPNSKLVELEIRDRHFSLFGKSDEANSTVAAFFKAAGYHQNI